MKPERTKEEILNEAAREYARDHSAAPDKETPDWIIDDFKAGARWQESQSSPVESKLKQDFLEGDKLLGLAAHFVTPEPDGSANKTHFTDLVAVLMYYNDYLQGKIEETKEK